MTDGLLAKIVKLDPLMVVGDDQDTKVCFFCGMTQHSYFGKTQQHEQDCVYIEAKAAIDKHTDTGAH